MCLEDLYIISATRGTSCGFVSSHRRDNGLEFTFVFLLRNFTCFSFVFL